MVAGWNIDYMLSTCDCVVFSTLTCDGLVGRGSMVCVGVSDTLLGSEAISRDAFSTVWWRGCFRG